MNGGNKKCSEEPTVFRRQRPATMRYAPSMMSPDEQARFMRAALTGGRRALPKCRPNPPIGCVLVRGGEIVARGHTQPPYEHHAEPMALSQLEGELPAVIAFVTLEPCSFHNRTPSCAKQLIARRIGGVVVAMRDPHPRNQGAGIEMLRRAGIEVVEGVLEDEARADLAELVWQTGEDEASKIGD